MSQPADRPTRARFVLVLWLCGLAGVLYLDRLAMGQAAPAIQAELGLSNTGLSYAHIAFTLAYGLFEIPTGRLGDRVGARRVLTRIVLWWSLFTALTGVAFGLISLVVIRFLFGAGEAGAFPNTARVLSRWFPVTERGRVQGLLLAAAQLGGVAAPVAAAYVIEHAGWRTTFALFGLVGIAWAAGFWWWFRDEPATHPSINAVEAALIRAGAGEQPAHTDPIPWRAVARTPGFWILGLLMTCSAFNAYLYYSWFPKYLQAAHNLSNERSGWLGSLVLAGGAVGVLAGGVVADWLLRAALPVVWARRLFGATAYLAATACLVVAVRSEDPSALAALIALANLAVHLTLPTWWSCAIEQSGRHVGALFGLMNTMGVIGALASQWFVGWYADRRADLGYSGREQWDPMFDVYVGVLVVGAVAWAAYRFRPLEDGRPPDTTEEDGAHAQSGSRGTPT